MQFCLVGSATVCPPSQDSLLSGSQLFFEEAECSPYSSSFSGLWSDSYLSASEGESCGSCPRIAVNPAGAQEDVSAFPDSMPLIHHGNGKKGCDYINSLAGPSPGSLLPRRLAQPPSGHIEVGFVPTLQENLGNTTTPATPTSSSEKATLTSVTPATVADCTAVTQPAATGAVSSVVREAEEEGSQEASFAQLSHQAVQRREVCCERTSRIAAPSVLCISKSLPQVLFASEVTVHPVFHASASLYPSFVQSSYYSSEMDMSSALSSMLSRKMTGIREESLVAGQPQVQVRTGGRAITPHAEQPSNVQMDPSAKLKREQADSTQSFHNHKPHNKTRGTLSKASSECDRHPLTSSVMISPGYRGGNRHAASQRQSKKPYAVGQVNSQPELPLLAGLPHHTKYHSMESLPQVCSSELKSQLGLRRHLLRRSIKPLASLLSPRAQSSHTAAEGGTQPAAPDSTPGPRGLLEPAIVTEGSDVMDSVRLTRWDTALTSVNMVRSRSLSPGLWPPL